METGKTNPSLSQRHWYGDLEKMVFLYYTTGMIKKATRRFNTSGPNNPEKHYTLERVELVEKGMRMVKDERYFTIIVRYDEEKDF